MRSLYRNPWMEARDIGERLSPLFVCFGDSYGTGGSWAVDSSSKVPRRRWSSMASASQGSGKLGARPRPMRDLRQL